MTTDLVQQFESHQFGMVEFPQNVFQDILKNHRRRFGISTYDASCDDAGYAQLAEAAITERVVKDAHFVYTKLRKELKAIEAPRDDYLAVTFIKPPLLKKLPDLLTDIGRQELQQVWLDGLERMFVSLVKFRRVTDGYSLYYRQVMAYVR